MPKIKILPDYKTIEEDIGKTSFRWTSGYEYSSC